MVTSGFSKENILPNGSIEKYKARLVAKGFLQKQNVDYFNTFAPVTRISSIRIFIALASIHKLFIHQMDVKKTFLNGDLEEEIYMLQPEGYITPGQENKVCKLNKSLYGLKQAPKQWHEKFDNALLKNRFLFVEVDKCVYTKCTEKECVIIALYVDDMLIFGTSMSVVHSTKRFLASQYDMKDMGEAKVILGVNITRMSDSIMLSEEHYVKKILKRFRHFDAKPVSTPYDANTHLMKNRGDLVGQAEYAQIIGSLMHFMNFSRPT